MGEVTVTVGAAGFSATSLTMIVTVIVSSMMVVVVGVVGVVEAGGILLVPVPAEAVPDLHLHRVGTILWVASGLRSSSSVLHSAS